MTKTIAIIGLGYVGLPLAIEFGKKYPTLGFDINPTRIEELRNRFDRTHQINSHDFQEAKFLSFHTDIQELKNAQIYIITVPTPLDEYKNPDISYLLNASKMIAPLLSSKDIIIYESTTYPTCTLKDCVPILEQYSSLKYNIDFFVGYSPERINPGDREHKLPDIKKITSGSTPEVAKEIDELYASIITAGTYLAPSIEVAEMAKVIENAQRDLNIAFVNEIALICDKLGIETQEVLKASSTKWNFLPFKPGLVGGHCISIDPYYLTHKAHELGYHPRVISAGRLVNDAMPSFVAQKLIKLMIAKDIKILRAKILILGVTFKENCNDIRNSKVFEVIDELIEYGCEITLLDPLAIPEEVSKLTSAPLYSNLSEINKRFDGVLLAVTHKEFEEIDLASHTHNQSVIYDLKDVLKSSHARL
ncbi:nucleotide sugar dehydrogenase [uncultured Helicobacter sp.]|uniref:nucleotide sugar dehydrogenase n=1 Tax=uncultured Helicobacter sp. TaxID=175537 RepID=UPI00263866C0|nr:nucleotide sugar dehydrogenase [uncultured Helicobacter sp.]